MIENLNWLNEDCRDYFACTRYILFRCCKKAKGKYKLGKDIKGWERSITTEYIPIDFMDFKWMIDRCNFLLAKRHGLSVLPNSFLSWYIDSHFVPETFYADFTCEYKRQKNGKLKKYKPKFKLYEGMFISGAEQWAMNKVIWRWKVYGRLCVKIENLIWKLRNKLKKG